MKRCLRCADVLSMMSLLMNVPSLEHIDLHGCVYISPEQECNPANAAWLWSNWVAPAGALKGILSRGAHNVG